MFMLERNREFSELFCEIIDHYWVLKRIFIEENVSHFFELLIICDLFLFKTISGIKFNEFRWKMRYFIISCIFFNCIGGLSYLQKSTKKFTHWYNLHLCLFLPAFLILPKPYFYYSSPDLTAQMLYSNV